MNHIWSGMLLGGKRSWLAIPPSLNLPIIQKRKRENKSRQLLTNIANLAKGLHIFPCHRSLKTVKFIL